MSKTQQLKTKRSKKYNSNQLKIQTALQGKEILELNQAVELLFNLDQPKFKEGPSIELHLKLSVNPTKSDQFVRSSVVLPHGTGKKIRIAAFVSADKVELAKKAGAQIVGGEDLIEQIKSDQKIDFDIAIAQPELMKKLPVIARLLGTAGVMPNPKTGTVGENVEEMINLIKSGKVDFKNDKTSNLHILCGKINGEFTAAKIVENVQAALDAVEKAKPEAIKKKYILSAHLATSQSPSIRIS
jgi:large subunit ribosomal protein L1